MISILAGSVSCDKVHQEEQVEQILDSTYFQGSIGGLGIYGPVYNRHRFVYGDTIVSTVSCDAISGYAIKLHVVIENNSPYLDPSKWNKEFYRFDVNFANLIKGSYTVTNPEKNRQPGKPWVYYAYSSYPLNSNIVTEQKKYEALSSEDPLVLYVDNIQADRQTNVPVVSGRMKGYLHNIDDLQDSVFIDVKFVSKSYGTALK
jgi:hypothetical protein